MQPDDPLSRAKGDGGRNPGGLLDAISDAVAGVWQAFAPSVVGVRITRPGPLPAPTYATESEISSSGSGVIISPEGYVLTCEHVVGRARTAQVFLNDGAEVAGVVGGIDSETDLAVVKIDGGPFPDAEWAPAGRLDVGTVVITVGRSHGMRITASWGVVSALDCSLRSASGQLVENAVQTDAALNPGCSGGALVDSRARLAGINTAAAEHTRGISFAIPADTARWVANDLISRGRVVRGYLGIVGRPVAVAFPDRDLPGASTGRGVKVLSLVAGGPAEQAGLRRDDVIVALGGQPVSGPHHVQRIAAGSANGEHLRVVVLRGERVIETGVMPTPHPAAPGVRV